MSGPFYGSLAASASVFVAILTALLTNNLVQIKSDRRQVKNELEGIEEDLDGLRDQRDNYQGIVDDLVEKRESDYREKAKKQVDEFVESEIPSEYIRPIERVSVDELYRDLIFYHGYDSAAEFEDSPINRHHKDLLEEQFEAIEDQILEKIVPSFASKYEGKGWDPDYTGLSERLKEIAEADDRTNKESGNNSDVDHEEHDIEIEEASGRDVLEQDEFINKYKEEYGLDRLSGKTTELLIEYYDNVVDKNPNPSPATSASVDDLLRPNLSRSLQQEIAGLAATGSREWNDPFSEIDFERLDTNLGLNMREQQKLEKARENLQEKENKIEILEQRKARLNREKQRLHPEDLLPILAVNGVTIILSVVIPIFAYLLLAANIEFTDHNWLGIFAYTEAYVFFSWLLGLFVVFESIHARINNRNPKSYTVYHRIRSGLW